MAYREFRNEAYYKAPEIGNLMPQTIGVLDTAMKIKAQKGAQGRQRMDEMGKVDKTGYWTKNTNDIINDSQKLTDVLTYARMNGMNTIPPQAEQLKQSIDAKRERGKTLKETADRAKATLAQMQNDDPYFKPDIINQKLLQLNNPELELDDIEGILGEVSQMAKDKTSTYNIAKRAKDYVDSQGEIADKNDNTYASGVRIQKSTKGKFFENGVNKIGDTVVEDFLKDPQTNQYYDQKLSKDISDDLEKIIAGRMNEIPDNEKGSALKAMIAMGHDEDAVNYLKENPQLNPLDKRTPFERKRDQIVPELKRYEDIANDNSADYSKTNPFNKYGTSGSVSKDMEFASGHTNGGGPSIIAVKKNGSTPSVKGANVNGLVRNSSSGEVMKIGGSGADIAINDWHVGVLNKNGAPVNIPGTTLDESLQYIKNAPIDEVRNWAGAAPIARGSILNKANVIDAKQKLKKAFNDLDGKKDNLDTEGKKDLEVLREQLGGDIDFGDEVVQKYLGDMISNVSFKMDKVTSGSYEAQTGIDPLSKKALTPEMKEMERAINNRIKEAKPLIEQKDQEEAATAKERAKAMVPFDGKKATTNKATKKTITYRNEEYEVPDGQIAMLTPDGGMVTINADKKQKAIDKGYKVIE